MYAHVHKHTIYLFLIIVICNPNAKATFIPVKDYLYIFFLMEGIFTYKIQKFCLSMLYKIILITVRILYICCCSRDIFKYLTIM